MEADLIRDLKKANDLNECQNIINNFTRKCKTLYSENYIDYEQRECYETLKAYEILEEDSRGRYMILLKAYENMKTSEFRIGFTDIEPRKPITIFPLLSAVFNPCHQVYIYKMSKEGKIKIEKR